MSTPDEPTPQDLDGVFADLDRLLEDAARSGQPGELGMSRPYVHLIHHEIGPTEYAKSLQELARLETETRDSRRERSTSGRSALLVRQLELQAQSARLAEEYNGARQAVAKARDRQRMLTVWARFAIEILLVTAITAFLGIVWVDVHAISVAHLLPSGFASGISLVSGCVTVALLAGILWLRRTRPQPQHEL